MGVTVVAMVPVNRESRWAGDGGFWVGMEGYKEQLYSGQGACGLVEGQGLSKPALDLAF